MLKTSLLRRGQNMGAKRAVRSSQRGIMIIEAMVSIMIVMLGILGIAGLLAKSTVVAGQAQYRTEAGMFADQIVQMIALNVDRTSDATLATSLMEFQHQPTGAVVAKEDCAFTGDAVDENTPLGELLKAARGQMANVAGLPGAEDGGQQVKVETGKNNKVTVTLCWKSPGDGAMRNYQLQAFVH